MTFKEWWISFNNFITGNGTVAHFWLIACCFALVSCLSVCTVGKC